jgi:hypothetical protein
VKGKCAFAGNAEGVCLAGRSLFMANTLSGVKSVDIGDPNHPRLADTFGVAEGLKPAQTRPAAFVETETSPHEREMIEYLLKTKQEVLQGRKFNDLSTPVHALLTLLSGFQNHDPNTVIRVTPLARQYPMLLAPAIGARFLDALGKATTFRVDVDDRSSQESDLAAIFFAASPGQKPNQIIKFGYVQGAWRFLGSEGGPSIGRQDWRPGTEPAEAATRNILREETKKDR